MKILHVYKDFDPPVHGGMEKHMALMCRFQREWAEVSALTCSRSIWTHTVVRDGTTVTEVGEWGRVQSAPLSPGFPWRLKRTNADIVVVHTPNPTAEISWLMTRPKGTLVIRYHSDVVRQAAAMKLYRPILERFLRAASVVVPTSQNYVDTSPYLGAVADKCRVIPLGIVCEDFDAPDLARVESLRTRYGGPYVLFAGRHRYYKGIEYLVRAAGSIQAPIVIAGEGPESVHIRDLAANLGVSIAFPGRLDHEDLVAHLHGAALVAFPSVERSEAFGISILEAHACAKPVVATRLGTGVEFANLDGQTGINVPPRNVRELAGAINHLLTHEDEARRLGAFAQQRVRQEFHARHIAEREFALFQELSECKPTGT